MVKLSIFKTVLPCELYMAKWSNLEIDHFTTLRRKWKCSILKIVSFTKLKTEKVKKIVKIEKYIFKTKACDSYSLAPKERAPQNYPKKCVNSKSPKIELDGFTKPGPNIISMSWTQIFEHYRLRCLLAGLQLSPKGSMIALPWEHFLDTQGNLISTCLVTLYKTFWTRP